MLDSRLAKKDEACVEEDDCSSELATVVADWHASTDWKFDSHVGAAPNVAIDEICVTI
jgi:hypothetical protein